MTRSFSTVRGPLTSITLATLTFVALGCDGDSNKNQYPYPRATLGIENPVTGRLPEGFFKIDIVLRPTFPNQDLIGMTEQYGVVIREKTNTDQCAALWSKTHSTTREGGALVNAADANTGNGITPVNDGPVTILLYAYATTFDLLCQTDDWCEESTSGTSCQTVPSGVSLCTTSPPPVPLLGWCETGTITPQGANIAFSDPQEPPAQ